MPAKSAWLRPAVDADHRVSTAACCGTHPAATRTRARPICEPLPEPVGALLGVDSLTFGFRPVVSNPPATSRKRSAAGCAAEPPARGAVYYSRRGGPATGRRARRARQARRRRGLRRTRARTPAPRLPHRLPPHRLAADAEDAAQAGFVKAWQALGRFRRGAPFRPWLLAIVANEAKNRHRAGGRRDALAERLAAEAGSGDAAPSPERALERRAEQAELAAALARLPEEQRVTVGLPLPPRPVRRGRGRRPRRAPRHGEVAALPRARAPARGGVRVSERSRSSCARSARSSSRRSPTSAPAVLARLDAAPRRRAAAPARCSPSPRSCSRRRWPRSRSRRRAARSSAGSGSARRASCASTRSRRSRAAPRSTGTPDDRARRGARPRRRACYLPQRLAGARRARATPPASSPAGAIRCASASSRCRRRPLLREGAHTTTRPSATSASADSPASGSTRRHAVQFAFGQPELAGKVLIWEQGGVTLRLDGTSTSRPRLRIARSTETVKTP